jgi:hypothetical protein
MTKKKTNQTLEVENVRIWTQLIGNKTAQTVLLGQKYESFSALFLFLRNLLDFDFEKLCSITLSNNNVYACLVCGKYFQGRGIKSHAYTHSVLTDHHVYINLNTYKFYCLPDNYQVIDSSLEDIKVTFLSIFFPFIFTFN